VREDLDIMVFEVPSQAYQRAIASLESGGIIAYPTEAVYGIGCDPFNSEACHKILTLKQRSQSKGVILIASDWEQIEPLVACIDTQRLKEIQKTWPGPYTWIFPRTQLVPDWISGEHDTIAVRVTAHPIVSRLCKQYGKPIVSTSANIGGQMPAKDNLEVFRIFGEAIDYILPGRVGDLQKPTEIRNAINNQILRPGAD